MTDSENRTLEVEVPEGTALPASGGPEAAGSAAEADTPIGERRQCKPGEYEIIPPSREAAETGFVADPEALAAVMAAVAQKGSGALKGGKIQESGKPLGLLRRFTASPTKVYAAVGIGLGLLAGMIAAALFLHPGGQSGANDMGTINAAEYGLKGHLTVNWKEQLEYQVTIEPADAAQAAAFTANVNSSARPLAIEIQAKDPFGAVLCGDTILLKFDPRNALGGATAEPGLKTGGVEKTGAEKAQAERNEIAQSLNLVRLEGQEFDREHGKTLFKNDTGQNGHIASIGAQGVLPCTRQQYERVASWGFTSNFPLVGSPTQNGAAGVDEASAGLLKGTETTAKGRTKRKAAPPAPPIYVEGDDAIMSIDAASGAMETRGGKVLLADKTDGIATTLKGRDFPIPIHYRCDQEGSCTFGGVGTGVHRARLRR